eukprot:COSAG01_NODE_2816_length_7019_cov_22.384682_1_plen_60_part_00
MYDTMDIIHHTARSALLLHDLSLRHALRHEKQPCLAAGIPPGSNVACVRWLLLAGVAAG